MPKHTNEKECYCITCDRDFNYLGITSHRAMHRRRNEDCKIMYTNGNTIYHNYSMNKDSQ